MAKFGSSEEGETLMGIGDFLLDPSSFPLKDEGVVDTIQENQQVSESKPENELSSSNDQVRSSLSQFEGEFISPGVETTTLEDLDDSAKQLVSDGKITLAESSSILPPSTIDFIPPPSEDIKLASLDVAVVDGTYVSNQPGEIEI